MKYTEFGLINKIRNDFLFDDEGIIGIGDDAAVISFFNKNLLITTDALVDGKHFLSEKVDFFLLGYKSLAVNISDIAAMGGKPLFFLLTLGLSDYLDDSQIDMFFYGLKSISKEYCIHLIGGDCVGAKDFFVSITLLGEPFSKPILRRGAKAKENIYVTGSIGDSAFGLSLLLGKEELLLEEKDFFIERHLKPVPRVGWMEKIISMYKISSAIDVSDGLLGDLIHIAEESKCGFELYLDRIPLSKEKIGAKFCEMELNYILQAITGGEDYEIIFTSPDEIDVEKLEKEYKIKVTKIGSMVDEGYNLFFKERMIDFAEIKKVSFTHF
ncbi:MAG: thiamine-phosphate kinase [Brevinematia bacterium]